MQTSRNSKNLLDLLYEGGDSAGPRIYSYDSITISLYRSLPSFEQSIIIKLLSAPTLALQSYIAKTDEAKELTKIAEDTLIKKFGVVEKFTTNINAPLQYRLSKDFARSLKRFLTSGMQVIFQVNTSTMEKCITHAEKFEAKLSQHSYQGWSNLYRTMLEGYLSPTSYHERINLTENIKSTLENANLNLRRAKSHTTGFDFLLDSIRNQVSLLLYAYCRYLFKVKYKYLKSSLNDKEAVSEGSILNLLLNLTLLVPALSFSIKKSLANFEKFNLPEALIQDVLKDLHCIGLLRVKVNDGGYVTTLASTPLIHNVLTGSTALHKEFKNHIIVETDFKCYAYTHNNDFLEALLRLFTVVKTKFPGLLVCSIQEDKIVEAFQSGITPNQILRYLNSNAHETVVEKKLKQMTDEEIENIELSYAFIPENVVQQIFIWYKQMEE